MEKNKEKATMMKKIIPILFILCITISSAMAADPKAIVEIIFDKAKNEIIITDTKAQADINKLVNFNEMAKNALGNKYSTLSKEQIDWFSKTLKEIITKTVYPEAPKFLKEVKITYEGVKIAGGRANIDSVVKKRGEETEVSYHLFQFVNGWQVVDISLDGDSWIDSIKEQVLNALQKHGWVGLKEKLSKRLSDLQTSPQQASR